MKKWMPIAMLSWVLLMWSPVCVHAQAGIAQVIAEGVKKVIRAVDLRIQRLQNQTIWLQNAQKAIENTLSKLRLDEITNWVERQRVLYQDYFDELARVKQVIAYYHRVNSIIRRQVQLVNEYKRAYDLFKQDDHFSANELVYMGRVYTGILEQSLKNLDQLFLVINSFATTMSDAKRVEMINAAGDGIDQTYQDLRTFNRQNMTLSLQRASDLRDVQTIKKLYGLPD
ncbi:MAG: conjugal transfer protein TraI [Sphingobacteriales bacterium 44-61]|nr:MAG: conjugal transfer protein TraI [Sphingobacteriales bacterium 44-61]